MQSVTHFEIPCDNLERAGRFYGEVFGWTVQAIPDLDYQMVQTVETDEQHMPVERGAINGGFYARSEHASRTPVLVINVGDIDEAGAAIKRAGGMLIGAVHQVGDMGRYVQFRDSEGNVLGLWQSLHVER